MLAKPIDKTVVVVSVPGYGKLFVEVNVKEQNGSIHGVLEANVVVNGRFVWGAIFDQGPLAFREKTIMFEQLDGQASDDSDLIIGRAKKEMSDEVQ